MTIGLRPRAGQEIAQEGRQRQRLERGAQALAEALLDAPLELLAAQGGGRSAGTDFRVRLVGDEALELEQLGIVEIELVEVAVDDLVDEPVRAGEQLRGGTALVAVERAGERGHRD
jgi:hypothetical protein